MNRRLLYLITSLTYGGAESQLVELARGFTRLGWQVRVVCMTPLGPKAQDLKEAGIRVESLNMKPGRPSLTGFWQLVCILRDFQPTVLHAHMVHANLLARLVRPFASVPVLICTAHNIIEGGRWREVAYRVTDPLCDLTTQVSEAGLRRYLEVGAISPSRALFMPNGVDTKRFAPDAQSRAVTREQMGVRESFVWLAVGRFTEAKDYPTLLRAFSEVVKTHPEARLWLVGQGALLEPMQALTQTMHLDNHVHFLGTRDDIPCLMNAADAYVMSSAWEGTPMVLLEAAAVGLPIVATDVGGNGEVVKEGQNGWLVPPKDHTRLAAAMHLMMQQPVSKRKEMSKKGREFVIDRYDLQEVISRWEALYRWWFSVKSVKALGEH